MKIFKLFTILFIFSANLAYGLSVFGPGGYKVLIDDYETQLKSNPHGAIEILKKIDIAAKNDVKNYNALRTYLAARGLYPHGQISAAADQASAAVANLIGSKIKALESSTTGPAVPPAPPIDDEGIPPAPPIDDDGVPVAPPIDGPDVGPAPGPKPTPTRPVKKEPKELTEEDKRNELRKSLVDTENTHIQDLINKINKVSNENPEIVNKAFPGIKKIDANKIPILYLNELRTFLNNFGVEIKNKSEEGKPLDPETIKETIKEAAIIYNLVVNALVGVQPAITALLVKTPAKFIQERLSERKKETKEPPQKQIDLVAKSVGLLRNIISNPAELEKIKDQFSKREGAAGIKVVNEPAFQNYKDTAAKAIRYFNELSEQIQKEGEEPNKDKLAELNKVIGWLIPNLQGIINTKANFRLKQLDIPQNKENEDRDPNLFYEYEELLKKRK